MDQLPADLPQETHRTYLGFLSSRPLTRELLTAKVRKYLDTICQASDEDQHLDIATSSDLGRGLLRLLRDCADEALPHVQAAIYYFVECEDAEPDQWQGVLVRRFAIHSWPDRPRRSPAR